MSPCRQIPHRFVRAFTDVSRKLFPWGQHSFVSSPNLLLVSDKLLTTSWTELQMIGFIAPRRGAGTTELTSTREESLPSVGGHFHLDVQDNAHVAETLRAKTDTRSSPYGERSQFEETSTDSQNRGCGGTLSRKNSKILWVCFWWGALAHRACRGGKRRQRGEKGEGGHRLPW